MKVKTQNLKLQFLSQLRKHLKSPSLNKILNPRKRRKKKKSCADTEVPKMIMQGSEHAFQVKTIRNAGEKLKLGFKRNWQSDIVAQRRKDLFEYALYKNKILTASSIVSADNIKKNSSFTEVNSPGPTVSSSSSEAEAQSSSTKAFTSKEYYLDYSTSDDSASNEVNYERALKVEQSHPISSVDVGVQCFDEVHSSESSTTLQQNLAEELPVEPETQSNLTEADPCRPCFAAATEHKHESIHTVSEKASLMLEKMTKFLNEHSSCNTPTTKPEIEVASSSLRPTSFPNRQNFFSPGYEQEPCQQSYSASRLASKSVLNELSNTSREFYSENISSTRSNLLRRCSPSRTSRANHRHSKKRLPRYLHQISSDSDSSDDETLQRIKRKLHQDDAMTRKFFSSRCAPLLWSPSVHPGMLSDSSSDSPYVKPLFLH